MAQIDLKKLNDHNLILNTKTLVAQERETTAEILKYLAEIDSRRLYAQHGYSSLWEFATKELRYSAGAAYRRIDAMRLLKSLTPDDRHETHKALNDGRLNLTSVNAMAQFLKDEKKQNNKTYDPAEKKKILQELEGKSKPECERALAAINPANAEKARRHIDTTRALSAHRVEVCFAMGEELTSNLDRIKSLWAHHFRGTPTYEELLLKMSQLVLEKIDPLKQGSCCSLNGSAHSGSVADTNTNTNTNTNTSRLAKPNAAGNENIFNIKQNHNTDVKLSSATEVTTPLRNNSTHVHKTRPYISVMLKRAVWRRDGGQCTFVNTHTGQRCTSRHFLQLDHGIPFSWGGKDTFENLSLKCATHNTWMAIDKLGRTFMGEFVDGLGL